MSLIHLALSLDASFWSSSSESHCFDDRFANEPSIMKYIKIAASLRDKTVRDVALRCRWMTRKRRKQEDYNLGKKVKDRKEKSAELPVKAGSSSTLPLSFIPNSLSSKYRDHGDVTPSAALLGTRHLLEENNQALNQIAANLSTVKFQDNINLFIRTRTNITAILNDMRNMPGIMSQMPPLPVLLNEELASSVLPSTTQVIRLLHTILANDVCVHKWNPAETRARLLMENAWY
ncbi:hypothetical protein KY289_000675 [Solanum tuberosum]|nr:hypothetical protein KY289_000675 [Solanum tuberosum]